MLRKGHITAGLKALNDAGAGTAVIATLGVVDKDQDLTLPGAFGNEQQAKLVPAHDWSHVPLGKAKIREDGDQVMADFQLNLKIPSAQDWHAALKFDLENGRPIQEWSYGFTILDSGQGEVNGQRVRFLKSLRVHEISPVMLGAGEGTRTVTVKGKHGGRLADQLKEALEAVNAVLQRCEEAKALRKEDGRDLSADRYAELKELKERMMEAVAVIDTLGAGAEGAAPKYSPDQLLAEYTAILYRK